jgi:hypothetical protein
MCKERTLSVMIKSAAQPIRGDVIDAAGTRLSFVGWLALISSLDQAILAMPAEPAPERGASVHRFEERPD